MELNPTLQQPPRAWLYFVRDGQLVRQPLGNGRTLIGRGQNNDVVLDAPEVALHHAVVIARADGHYLSTACEQTPWVNGVPAHHTLRLEDGDVLEIGGVAVRVAQPQGAVRPPVQLGVLAGGHHPRVALFDGLEAWLGMCRGEPTVHDTQPSGGRCYLEHAAPGVLFATPLVEGVWIDGRRARGRTRVLDGSVIDLGAGRVAIRLLSGMVDAA